jgi:uncharacterized protein YqhQ
VLLRTPGRWAVAIRGRDGTIHTEAHPIADRWPRLRKTIARGPIAIVDAVSIGTRALRVAVREATGAEPTAEQMLWTLVSAFVGIVAVFVVAPGAVFAGLPDALADALEAAGRAAVLLVYLVAVSRSAQARRLFSYHGAEHEVVAAFEKSETIPTRAAARSAGPIHPRCGTSFIAILVVVAGIVFALVPREPLWAGALWRVCLVPVVAAISYEVMRASAREPPGLWTRLISAPGRALQRLTTREPTDDQLDVALAALAVLLA